MLVVLSRYFYLMFYLLFVWCLCDIDLQPFSCGKNIEGFKVSPIDFSGKGGVFGRFVLSNIMVLFFFYKVMLNAFL